MKEEKTPTATCLLRAKNRMSHLRTGNLNKSIPFNIPASVLPFEYSVTSSFQERQEVWKEFPDA